MILTCTANMKISDIIWLDCGILPPRPMVIRERNCIAFTKRIEKHSTIARGWRKCLAAQIIAFGGSSHGTTLELWKNEFDQNWFRNVMWVKLPKFYSNYNISTLQINMWRRPIKGFPSFDYFQQVYHHTFWWRHTQASKEIHKHQIQLQKQQPMPRFAL